MRILYFAWLRERVGIAEETVDLPADIRNVAGLLDWLRSRGDTYATALADLSMVRVAVNQDYARPDDPVSANDEVALFPPVTGG
ncbi:MAG TPA: molybdopterin converting factor subunit 1 [Ferrovibrio sp.]|jgi:molybdopterin synthase sulfur carrier subunit|uniref:molybdopterin converting factor subunit 1 n=1 Tax=Ferrovibrio sp. TaxID=1917215 RepID=UPI002B4AFD1A|nr:molybdopterin converting factor subunit 1 [Ferrovibrio sp.]HLT76039.1 molybdopterin converting factor subunit 1 [Ferrovibrio sp.]